MQQNNGQSSMSNYNSSSKKMKAGVSDRDGNDNDMQFSTNILSNASAELFPDQFSTPPNNAIITACSPTTLVNRLDQPHPQGSSSRVNIDDGNYIDPYFRGFAPGIRFFPRDQELVVEYLMKKIRNEPLPKNRIHEVNIYEYHPKTLAEKYKLYSEDAWYFFTTRSKKYPNGNRPDRGVPGGFWKPTGSPDTKILDENSNTMVERRSLDFYEGKGKGGSRTDWKMHEYYPTTNNVSSSNTKGMRLNDCILCRIYLKGEKQNAEAKKTGKKSRNDGNTVSHGPADSRNDASTSYNYNSQQPANHAAFTSDTMEVYFNGIQPCYDYNMNQCCYGDNSNQIAAMMEPAIYTLPNSIEGTGRGFSQRVAFAVPSSSMPLTMNVAGLNGPSSSMPLTMHGAGFKRGPNSLMPRTMHAAGLNEPNSTMHLAGLNGPNFSMPLTMHGAGLNGSSMPLTMFDARLNGPASSSIPLTMHGAGLNGPNSSMMHGARLNGPNSSTPLTMHGARLNGSSMPLTMHGAGLNGSSMPLITMHGAELNGSSMPLTMHGAGLNGPISSMPLTMHAAGLNEPTSSMPLTMHAAGLNGPISSMPPTTLPIDNMEGNDHLVEPNNDIQFNNHQELNDDLRNSLPDSAFRDDAMARIHEMWVSSNSRREG
ncbi:hypothetical protein Peur_070817 [Populus x canadensis]